MRILNASEAVLPVDLKLPGHVALIMDGNRRWGYARQIPAEESHRSTSPALASVILGARTIGIPHLTFFCLSTENLSRPSAEVDELLNFESWLWTAEVHAALEEAGARVELAGDLENIQVRDHIPVSLASFREPDAPLVVTFAVNYGSQQELQLASERTRATARPISDGLHLPLLPPVDLLIRTGGDQRLSNFMLWQAAYAELVFTDTLWPDFTGLHLASAVWEYSIRDRRFGR